MLKYLFKVEFQDGTTFTQSKEDVSELDPKRSAFYDILQSDKKIKKFTLRRFLERYSVDLTTGEFEINGTKIIVESDLPFVENNLPKLELVFYRQHKQAMDVTFALGSRKILSSKPQTDKVTYFIGFKTTVKKKEYKSVIGIN